MPLKRTGLQTIDLPLRPAVCASAAFVGKKEGEGPLGNLFDHVAQDELYGQDTFELAEKRLYLNAIRKAIQKGGLKPENAFPSSDCMGPVPPWPKACAWAACSSMASTPPLWSARPAAISAPQNGSTAILWSSAPNVLRRHSGL